MPPKQPVAGPSRLKGAAPTAAPPPAPNVSAFNPALTHFACAFPVLGSADKVTVWDVTSDRVVHEFEVEGASKVTTLVWTTVPVSREVKKKRRRKAEEDGLSSGGVEDMVMITTDKGEVMLLSPSRGQVVKKWEVGKVGAAWSGVGYNGVILATEDSILLLSPDGGSVSLTYSLPPNIPAPSAISLLPSSTHDMLHIVIGAQSVLELHLNLRTNKTSYTSSPLPASTTSITALQPLPTSTSGTSFLVISSDDRTVSQYTIPSPKSLAKLSYRYSSPTISPVHSVSLDKSLVTLLHASGEVSVFPIPTELDFARPKSDSKPSTLKLVEGGDASLVRLCRVGMVPAEGGAKGSVICGRLMGGGRIKWVRAVYEAVEGGIKASTVVKCDAKELVNSGDVENTIPLQRYTAPEKDVEMPEVDEEPPATLPTDVDMADQSLGERLLALPNGTSQPQSQPNTDPLPNGNGNGTSKIAIPTYDGPVNAASLTRILIQALHTSDPALLTLCFSHKDPVLIRNTIRKMPSQLALPLLKACVERLGRGKGANKRGEGRGAGQNEQQGRGTVEWVKGVLVERGAMLMTIPSLPQHLAALSSLLQSRLQLYQPLLNLSGRLDLALAQISMRKVALENMPVQGGKGAAARYVEGESSDEEEDEGVEVEVEEDGGEGEVEDVDMRGFGSDADEDIEESDGEDDNEEEEDDDDDDDDEDDPLDSDGAMDEDEDEGSGSGSGGSASEDEDEDED